MDIFKLVGSIYVDNTEANKSISKTSEETETLGTKLSNGIGTAAKWAAGVATAAIAAGTAIYNMAKESASNLDTVDKASQRMGISAEEYQELAYQANLCGVEMTTMEKAAKKLEGTDISFDEAMESIYALGTAEERSAKAAELFGDTVAYNMSPMLNASAEDMAAMAEEANNLGLVLDQDTVTAGANMNDMMTKIEESFSSVTTKIGAELMPVINEVLQWVLDHMPEIQDTISKVMSFCSDLIQALIPVIKDIAPVVEDLINLIVDVVTNVLIPIIEAVWPIIQKIWGYIEPLLHNVIDFVKSIFSGDIQGALNSLFSGIKNIFAPILNVFKEPLQKVISYFSEWWQKAKEPFTKLKDAIGNIWSGIKSFFKLPHFYINGSLNPIDWISGSGMPSIGVDWYAKGGIMNDPTMFGFNPETGNAMVGGEAGAEAIAPIATLEDYFKKWSVNDELNDKVDALLNVVTQYLPNCANQQLVLDTGALVGGMSSDLNKNLYKTQSKERRGL